MRDIYYTMECDECGETLRNRCLDLTAGPDDPIEINLDMLGQTEFRCEPCGISYYYGDFDYISEKDKDRGGDDDDENEED